MSAPLGLTILLSSENPQTVSSLMPKRSIGRTADRHAGVGN